MPKDALYLNANAPTTDRVEDLLRRMTLAEKVAQVTAVSLRDSTSAEEGLAVYYSQKAISHYKDYLDEEAGPLFPFGFGLSYTRFAYTDLALERTMISADEELAFAVTIENTGGRSAAEVVQVYFRDCVASVVRPAKLLVRFKKVQLEPGERRRLQFSIIPSRDLAFAGVDLLRRVEAGAFELFVGSSSVDTRAQARFTLSPVA